MTQWFRYYTETLDDPKVQRLPGDTFKGWVNLLSLAARNDGVLPPHADIAFALRLPDAKTTALLDTLIDAGLFDHDETGIRPHNWNGRQYKTDVTDPTNAERQKRWRNGKRNGDHNGAETHSKVTTKRPEAETESEQIKPNPNGLGKKPTKGTRLAADWEPDSEDRGFCRAELGWNDERIDAEASKFADYWHEQPGQRGIKIRWHGTWRNWCRRAAESKPGNAPAKPGRPAVGERRNAIYASVADELEPVGTAASERGRPESGDARGHAEPVAILSTSPRGADGAHVCEPSDAAEGIAQDVAGTVGEVPAGRSETGDGSGDRNPQMGDAAEDCPGGGSRRIGRELSAEIEGERRVEQRADSSGLGREGPEDGDLLEIPDFLRRKSA